MNKDCLAYLRPCVFRHSGSGTAQVIKTSEALGLCTAPRPTVVRIVIFVFVFLLLLVLRELFLQLSRSCNRQHLNHMQ